MSAKHIVNKKYHVCEKLRNELQVNLDNFKKKINGNRMHDVQQLQKSIRFESHMRSLLDSRVSELSKTLYEVDDRLSTAIQENQELFAIFNTYLQPLLQRIKVLERFHGIYRKDSTR